MLHWPIGQPPSQPRAVLPRSPRASSPPPPARRNTVPQASHLGILPSITWHRVVKDHLAHDTGVLGATRHGAARPGAVQIRRPSWAGGRRKTAEVTVESGTCQITVEPGITHHLRARLELQRGSCEVARRLSDDVHQRNRRVGLNHHVHGRGLPRKVIKTVTTGPPSDPSSPSRGDAAELGVQD